MIIKDKLLNYALSNPGEFSVEKDEDIYYLYFNDEKVDLNNSIKVGEDGVMYTTLDYDFNNNLGFASSIAASEDEKSINMICEGLNVLKKIYTKTMNG